MNFNKDDPIPTRLSNLPIQEGNSSSSRQENSDPVIVYEPLQPADVIFGKSRRAHANTGNRRFRVLIECHVESYVSASDRTTKSQIINEILRALQDGIGARFVKEHPTIAGAYLEVSDSFSIRQKIGYALRDAVRTAQKSSTST